MGLKIMAQANMGTFWVFMGPKRAMRFFPKPKYCNLKKYETKHFEPQASELTILGPASSGWTNLQKTNSVQKRAIGQNELKEKLLQS